MLVTEILLVARFIRVNMVGFLAALITDDLLIVELVANRNNQERVNQLRPKFTRLTSTSDAF